MHLPDVRQPSTSFSLPPRVVTRRSPSARQTWWLIICNTLPPDNRRTAQFTHPKLPPLIIPTGLDDTELRSRLQSMKDYRDYQIAENRPQHVLKRETLEAQLARSGYRPSLASRVFGKPGGSSCSPPDQNEPAVTDDGGQS